MKSFLKILTFVFFFTSALVHSDLLYASSGITYQGRLLKPDGTPVVSPNVQFRMQVKSPGAEDCLLYEEIQTVDLSGTKGVFAISLNDGSGTRQDSNPWGLFDALSNRKSFTFSPGECSGPNSYTPSATDNRKFRVYFKEDPSSSWESLPIQIINYIPMSIESYAVGGFAASSLLRVEDGGTLGDVDPITTTQYNEIIDLVNGNSSLYSKSGELGGSALPSLSAGQVIVSDGSGGWQAANPITTESDPTVEPFAKASLPTCGTGEILTSNGISLSCVSDSGGPLVESDIPQLTSAGNGVDGGAIASGTIGGSTAINTSGNIETSGNIIASGAGGRMSSTYGSFRRLEILDDQALPNKVTLRSPSSLVSNYELTLPPDMGTNGQVLSTNGSGGLAWINTFGSVVGSALPLNQVFIGDADGEVETRYFGVADLRNSSGTPQIQTCTDSQTLKWNFVTDTLSCTDILITTSQVSDLSDLDNTYFKQGGNSFGALAVLGTADANSLQFETDNATRMTILGDGRVGIGTTDPVTSLHILSDQSDATVHPDRAGLILESEGTSVGGRIAARVYSDSQGPYFIGYRSNGSVSSPEVLTTNGLMLGLEGVGYDGTDWKTGGAIRIKASENWSSVSNGTHISFHTTSAGGTYPAEVARISSDGNFGLGTTNPTSRLTVYETKETKYIGSSLRLNPNLTANNPSNYHASWSQITVDTAYDFSGSLYGSVNRVRTEPTNAGTVNMALGTITDVNHDSASHINTAHGGRAVVNNLSTGTIDTASGFSTSIYNSGGGTITTGYGIRIDTISATNKWALYSSDASALAYFAGNVGIGVSNPSTELEVAGTVKATSFEGPMTSTSVSISDGSASAPSMTFSDDSNTGFYSSGVDSVGISTGGTQVWNITTSSIASPAIGGASMSSVSGSASAPTFSFSGDEDTGWFRPAADTLAAATAGVERLRVTDAGNMGIGTSSPATRLHIEAGNTDQGGDLTVRSFQPGVQLVDKTHLPAHANDFRIFNSEGYLNVDTDTDNDGTYESNRLTINPDGYVGLGLSNPLEAMDINGDIYVRGDTIYFSHDGDTNANNDFISFVDSNASIFPANKGVVSFHAEETRGAESWTSPTVSVSASGGYFRHRVGIGTLAPSNSLHVRSGGILLEGEGSGQSLIRITRESSSSANDSPGFVGQRGSGTLDTTAHPQLNDRVVWFGGSSNSGGTEAYASMSVFATEAHSDTAKGMDIRFATTANGTTSTSEKMRITGNGNVGVGTMDPSEKLHVVGNLRVQGSTDCTLGDGAGGTNCSSDIRLKTNVKRIENPLVKILSLRGMEFDWNEKSQRPGRHDIGVIAQDVEDVFPTAVIEDPQSGYKKVDYAVLIAPVIEAIRVLHQDFVDLFQASENHKREIAAIKDENMRLKREVSAKTRELEDVKKRLNKIERLLISN